MNTVRYGIGPHQERTEKAAQTEMGREVRDNASATLALWQIAHSLAVVADELSKDRWQGRV